MRVVHYSQRLPLGLKPGQYFAGIHPGLDDLQGDPAADRLHLIGDIHDPHPPFAELFAKFVGADLRAGSLGDLLRNQRGGKRRLLQKVARLRMIAQQVVDPLAKPDIFTAHTLKIRFSLRWRFDFEGLAHDGRNLSRDRVHDGTCGLGISPDSCRQCDTCACKGSRILREFPRRHYL